MGAVKEKRAYTRRAGTKLSEKDVDNIRHMVTKFQASQSDMAREYGVSRQYISLIVKGKSWKKKQ